MKYFKIKNLIFVFTLLVYNAHAEIKIAPGGFVGINFANPKYLNNEGGDGGVQFLNYANIDKFLQLPSGPSAISGGVSVDLGLHNNFSLVPSLMYETFGIAVKTDFSFLTPGTKEADYTYKQNFLIIMLAGKGILNFNKFNLYLATGPYFGFSLSESQEDMLELYGSAVPSFKGRAKSSTAGVGVQAGTEFKINKLRPFLRLSVLAGLSEQLEEPVDDESLKLGKVGFELGMNFAL